MHIGIIRYKNKIIYIDIKDNKVYGYYYHNKKKHIINLNTIAILINSLFDQTKEEFLETRGEYTIFINIETGYKHFYKDGKEDFLKFFVVNGENGILYEDSSPLNKKSKIKQFINKKAAIQYIIPAIIGSMITIPITNKLKETTNLEIQELEEAATETDSNQYYDFTEMCDAIQLTDTLSNQDKKILYNEELFKKISNTPMTEDRIMSLNEKLTNIKIVPYTKEDEENNQEKRKQGKKPNVGYYISINPNIIHVKDLENSVVKRHEFIHLLQDNSIYSYIIEASTELISNEYYKEPLNSYKEEVKRVKVLMEIIGSEPIWNIIFTGSDEKIDEFNDILFNNLSAEDYGELYSILITAPGNKTEEEMKEINKKFDRIIANLYKNIYHEKIENNEIIKYIYENDNIDNRHYFQDRENKEERAIKIREEKPLIDAITKEDFEIEFYKTSNIEITEEEYLKRKSLGESVHYNIDFAEGFSIKLITSPSEGSSYYLVDDKIKVYSNEELVELGYATFEGFYKTEKQNVSPEEVFERINKGENINREVKKVPSGYMVLGIEYNQEKEMPILIVQKETNWEPVRENINKTKKTNNISK